MPRSPRVHQFAYMKAPGMEHAFEVGDNVEVFCDHEKSRERIAELENLAAEPKFWDDQQRAQRTYAVERPGPDSVVAPRVHVALRRRVL